MDMTYVFVINQGTIKKIKIKFMQGGRNSYKAKTVTDLTKSDLDG